ncbi:MAG: hypothetical protein PF483_08555 [Halothiobacillus sp.]|jgi:hypothetical protein|nr:hypothetical protein [Halothiobacillus sp.]
MIDNDRVKMRLRELNPGDIVHAKPPWGASLICVITSIDNISIHTRVVTTQFEYSFGLSNGLSLPPESEDWGIDSIARLPEEIHNVMLGLDKKFQTLRLESFGGESVLTEEERRALLFVADYYPRHPLI